MVRCHTVIHGDHPETSKRGHLDRLARPGLPWKAYETASMYMYEHSVFVVGRDLFWIDLEGFHAPNRDCIHSNAESLGHWL